MSKVAPRTAAYPTIDVDDTPTTPMTMPNELTRILIVDDHEQWRKTVRALLTSRTDWHICGEGSNGREAIEQCKAHPHMILLDISMPVLNGLEAARHIRSNYPRIMILILATDDSHHFVLAAKKCGAHGILSKSRAVNHLETAISSLLRSETFYPTTPIA